MKPIKDQLEASYFRKVSWGNYHSSLNFKSTVFRFVAYTHPNWRHWVLFINFSSNIFPAYICYWSCSHRLVWTTTCTGQRKNAYRFSLIEPTRTCWIKVILDIKKYYMVALVDFGNLYSNESLNETSLNL